MSLVAIVIEKNRLLWEISREVSGGYDNKRVSMQLIFRFELYHGCY